MARVGGICGSAADLLPHSGLDEDFPQSSGLSLSNTRAESFPVSCRAAGVPHSHTEAENARPVTPQEKFSDGREDEEPLLSLLNGPLLSKRFLAVLYQTE